MYKTSMRFLIGYKSVILIVSSKIPSSFYHQLQTRMVDQLILEVQYHKEELGVGTQVLLSSSMQFAKMAQVGDSKQDYLVKV